MAHETVDKEATALGEMGLDYDSIMEGEFAELEPVKKTKRKNQYVGLEMAEKVIDAYAADLLEAYKSNESMEGRIGKLTESLTQYKKQFEETQEKLNKMSDSIEKLSQMEGLIATMEEQMKTFDEDKGFDQETIEEMRTTLSERQEEQERRNQEIEQMRTDVEDVLQSLVDHLEEEGIDILSDEEDGAPEAEEALQEEA